MPIRRLSVEFDRRPEGESGIVQCEADMIGQGNVAHE
jgi:hypothetical protein